MGIPGNKSNKMAVFCNQILAPRGHRGFLLVLFLGIMALISQETAAVKLQQPLTTAVYYESLCPDSVRFFRNQLAPNYEELKACLALQFIPFGKAKWSSPVSGEVSFTCQHGPRECEGNRVMACAINYLKDDPDLQAKILMCMMDDSDPPTAGPKCSEQLGLSFEPISTCSKEPLGDQLLIEMGKTTYALQRPPLTFVPTITINGNYSDSFRLNFRKEVCDRCGCSP